MLDESSDIDLVAARDVQTAAARVYGLVRRTPVLDVEVAPDRNVVFKLENAQVSGSFKIRGALNGILGRESAHTSVVAASGGNHGIAVAEACRRLGLRAEVFVPASTGPEKLRRIRSLGAAVTIVDQTFTEVEQRSRSYAEERGMLFVHPFDDPLVISGQGTVGLEILKQAPELSRLYVAVGGGGLLAGILAGVEGRLDIRPVEPELSPSLAKALRAGRPALAPTSGVAADSLGAPAIGTVSFSLIRQSVNDVICVTEDEIIAAQSAIWDLCRMAVEPAAACAFAGYLREIDLPGNSAVLLCGGNVELSNAVMRP